MICPSCGQEVPEQKFCVNCGSSLVDAAPQMPPQADQFGQQEGGYASSAGIPQPPMCQTPQTTPANQAPSAAFILAIVGLVLSCLFVTFVPGLVCSIIGLVLNSGYSKKGLDNPRKTPTMVLGIIGIVISVACLAVTVAMGALAAQVFDELDSQGIDIATDGVEVTTDSDGRISISVKDGESKGIASGASASASSGATSSSAGAASTLLKYDDAKYHDSDYNPSLYALVELSGSEFQDLLDLYNFYWDDDVMSWCASDGSVFGVEGASDTLTKSQIAQLPAGAAGQAVVYILTVEGYSTPAAAFDALSKGVETDGAFEVDDDVCFAIVRGSSGVKYLVAVSETDDDEQTFLLFTEESISNGVFEQLTGVDAGASIDEVWKVVSAG